MHARGGDAAVRALAGELGRAGLLAVRICGSIEALLELNGVSPRADAEWAEGSARAVYTLTWP